MPFSYEWRWLIHLTWRQLSKSVSSVILLFSINIGGGVSWTITPKKIQKLFCTLTKKKHSSIHAIRISFKNVPLLCGNNQNTEVVLCLFNCHLFFSFSYSLDMQQVKMQSIDGSVLSVRPISTRTGGKYQCWQDYRGKAFQVVIQSV